MIEKVGGRGYQGGGGVLSISEKGSDGVQGVENLIGGNLSLTLIFIEISDINI